MSRKELWQNGNKRNPSRQFWDRRRWKSGLSIVIWDCGRWKSGPCLLGFLIILEFLIILGISDDFTISFVQFHFPAKSAEDQLGVGTNDAKASLPCIAIRGRPLFFGGGGAYTKKLISGDTTRTYFQVIPGWSAQTAYPRQQETADNSDTTHRQCSNLILALAVNSLCETIKQDRFCRTGIRLQV